MMYFCISQRENNLVDSTCTNSINEDSLPGSASWCYHQAVVHGSSCRYDQDQEEPVCGSKGNTYISKHTPLYKGQNL